MIMVFKPYFLYIKAPGPFGDIASPDVAGALWVKRFLRLLVAVIDRKHKRFQAASSSDRQKTQRKWEQAIQRLLLGYDLILA